jgi:hypothetical protein
MRTTLVADQERVAIGEVARSLRLAVRGDEAAVGVVGATRSDAFGDETVSCTASISPSAEVSKTALDRLI